MIIFSIVLLLFYTNLQYVSSQSNHQRLLLTPLLRQRRIQEARSLSEVKISRFPKLRSYSGYFTVDERFDSNLFFWFFLSQNNYSKDPVILSLEGGPGISSLGTLFLENGPLSINKRSEFEFRNVSWNNNHSVIYIDNPVGTGFSYFSKEGGTSRNISIIADYDYEALIQFFQLFPELRKNDFYVAGLSYGAKYGVAISTKIHKKNLSASRKINLRGVVLGSGVLDPPHQYDFSEYLYQHGLVDKNGKRLLKYFNDLFVESLRRKNYVQAFQTFNYYFYGLYNVTSVFTKLTGYHYYYNLLYTSTPSYFRFGDLQDPIDKQVREYIHVGNTPYHGINFENTILDMIGDFMKTVAPMISKLLDNYPMIIFNGQIDVMGAYPGLVNVIENLKFNGQEDYKTAPRKIWYINNDVAGYVKQAGNLTEVMVRNAGHFTTADQPVWTEQIINRFTRNRPLV